MSIVGTRPNMMKAAPVAAELTRRSGEFEHFLIHTGQHYDREMSDIFLEELGLGEPAHMLGVGAGTHTQQVARVLERLEPVLVELRPDLVLVPGDVNSTLAAALTASQLGIPVGHIEAGLRSFDRTMPEELNRVLTDQLSQLLFTHSPEAEQNLVAEGRPTDAIHYVGNTMIDTLIAMRDVIARHDPAAEHGVEPGSYMVVTLHRPALVDSPLMRLALEALNAVAERMPVIFPVHPRTRARIDDAEMPALAPGLRLLEPLGYTEFLGLVASAAAVLTDSGGIQEETTYLGVPCFTLRDNTERPVTCEVGTNVLLGLDPGRIADVPGLIAGRPPESPERPPLWDGNAAGRIVDVIAQPLAPVRSPTARASMPTS